MQICNLFDYFACMPEIWFCGPFSSLKLSKAPQETRLIQKKFEYLILNWQKVDLLWLYFSISIFFHHLYVYLMQMPLFNLISNIWLIIMQSMLGICECEQFFCSNLIWCIKAISLMAPNKRHPHTRIDLEIVHILQCFQVAYNGAHYTKWSICLIQLKSNKINAMNMRATNG